VKKICMILVLCLMATFAYGQTQIDIKAKGLDEDIPGIVAPYSPITADTLIVGKIEFDEVIGPLGQVEFHLTIYADSGEKIYSMKGHLENGMVVPPGFLQRYCEVRNVTWINFWVVMGMGRIKTSEEITINYRGSSITLPDTGGKFVPAYVIMMVSPLGENLENEAWPGWSWAGIQFPSGKSFGGITYLTKYVVN